MKGPWSITYNCALQARPGVQQMLQLPIHNV